MILKNTDIETLLSRVKTGGKRLICFGAGGQLIDCCNYYRQYDFFHSIYRVVDNQKRIFTWRGQTLPVYPPDCLAEDENRETFIILISTLAYPEVYEQLEGLPQLAHTECYIFAYVKHLPLRYEFAELRRYDAPKIPKKIHSIWFGGAEIPRKNRVWMESWEKHCPDYEIVRWDESNYDVSKHPYISAAYKEKKWAFVSDWTRLDIVYEHGGVYLDNDVELLRNLDDLLCNDAFCGLSSLWEANFGLGFGAVAGHPLIAELRGLYDGVSFYKAGGKLNLTDCTKYQTHVLKKYGFVYANRPQMAAGMRIYPTDVLSPMDYLCHPAAYTPNTRAVHHFDASWLDGDDARKREERTRGFRRFFETHIFETDVR